MKPVDGVDLAELVEDGKNSIRNERMIEAKKYIRYVFIGITDAENDITKFEKEIEKRKDRIKRGKEKVQRLREGAWHLLSDDIVK